MRIVLTVNLFTHPGSPDSVDLDSRRWKVLYEDCFDDQESSGCFSVRRARHSSVRGSGCNLRSTKERDTTAGNKCTMTPKMALKQFRSPRRYQSRARSAVQIATMHASWVPLDEPVCP